MTVTKAIQLPYSEIPHSRFPKDKLICLYEIVSNKHPRGIKVFKKGAFSCGQQYTQQNSYSSSHYATLWLHGNYHSDNVATVI